MSRPKIGDVVEIDTGQGLAYAHYSHQHPMYGALLRVFADRKAERPADLAAVVAGEPTFLTFFPLAAALKRQIVSIAGNVPLSEQAKRFPTFRDGIADPRTGRVADWWLWDGEKEVRVGPLTDEIRRLSIRGVWNDTLLKERILSGWTPYNDAT
ncbi:MAG TPA: hypothetical protein PKA61_09870 [Nitrospira sp.]|nr:hypothetical protein [Nitrospira sp.]